MVGQARVDRERVALEMKVKVLECALDKATRETAKLMRIKFEDLKDSDEVLGIMRDWVIEKTKKLERKRVDSQTLLVFLGSVLEHMKDLYEHTPNKDPLHHFQHYYQALKNGEHGLI